MSSSSTRLPAPEGPGSVSGAEQMLTALTEFLAPYRNGPAAAHIPSQHAAAESKSSSR